MLKGTHHKHSAEHHSKTHKIVFMRRGSAMQCLKGMTKSTLQTIDQKPRKSEYQARSAVAGTQLCCALDKICWGPRDPMDPMGPQGSHGAQGEITKKLRKEQERIKKIPKNSAMYPTAQQSCVPATAPKTQVNKAANPQTYTIYV